MLLQVRVNANARHHESVEASEGLLLVRVKAPAREGKANQRALELLADHFSVSKRQVRLVRGARSRRKVFEIIT